MFTATRVVNVRHNVGKNGSHFVPFEGKFLLIKTCCQTLKHFDNVISTSSENVVEVFESLTTSF
jgi:hypothetical protein